MIWAGFIRVRTDKPRSRRAGAGTLALFLPLAIAACGGGDGTSQQGSGPAANDAARTTDGAALSPDGAWRILAVNETPVSSARAKDADYDAVWPGPAPELRVDGNQISVVLACGAVQTKLDPATGGPLAHTAETFQNGCSEAEEAMLSNVADLLRDPAVRFVAGPDGGAVMQGGEETALAVQPLPGKQGPPGGDADLMGRWAIQTHNGEPLSSTTDAGVTDGPFVYLSPFSVTVFSGCNYGGADVTWSGMSYTTDSPLTATERGCGAFTAQEVAIFDLVEGGQLAQEGNTLTITAPENEGQLVLAR